MTSSDFTTFSHYLVRLNSSKREILKLDFLPCATKCNGIFRGKFVLCECFLQPIWAPLRFSNIIKAQKPKIPQHGN